MSANEDLERRFNHHPPATPGRADLHEAVRMICKSVAYGLSEMVPDGREKSLALTKLEEVMFWANAAIARAPQ